MRNLLVHVVNAYEFWIVQHALKRAVTFTEYAATNSVAEVTILFTSMDQAVFDFITQFETSALNPIDLEIRGRKRQITPFELFTHVITHEFHHKGQVLSLSRHWGYLPVDTDIIG